MKFVIEYNGGSPRLEQLVEPVDRLHMPPPDKVADYLHRLGWYETEPGYWRQNFEGGGFTWEQAVSIEYLNFIMIGRENHAQGG
jgi:hypothetical protein